MRMYSPIGLFTQTTYKTFRQSLARKTELDRTKQNHLTRCLANIEHGLNGTKTKFDGTNFINFSPTREGGTHWNR